MAETDELTTLPEWAAALGVSLTTVNSYARMPGFPAPVSPDSGEYLRSELDAFYRTYTAETTRTFDLPADVSPFLPLGSIARLLGVNSSYVYHYRGFFDALLDPSDVRRQGKTIHYRTRRVVQIINNARPGQRGARNYRLLSVYRKKIDVPQLGAFVGYFYIVDRGESFYVVRIPNRHIDNFHDDPYIWDDEVGELLGDDRLADLLTGTKRIGFIDTRRGLELFDDQLPSGSGRADSAAAELVHARRDRAQAREETAAALEERDAALRQVQDLRAELAAARAEASAARDERDAEQVRAIRRFEAVQDELSAMQTQRDALAKQVEALQAALQADVEANLTAEDRREFELARWWEDPQPWPAKPILTDPAGEQDLDQTAQLSQRARTVLRREGIYTRSQLLQCSEHDLADMRGLGRVSLAEVLKLREEIAASADEKTQEP